MQSFSLIQLLAGISFLFIIAEPVFGDNSEDYLVLYDFNDKSTQKDFVWEDFSDQVMGGKSEMETTVRQESGDLFLRMRGEVSLENNGGFIQTRLKLAGGFRNYDASGYDGIRVLARGRGDGYYLFFRTANTFFPWMYHSAPVSLDDEWREIDIPWNRVKAGDFGALGNFSPSELKSIALVAYGKEFQAQFDLKQIGLYRNPD